MYFRLRPKEPPSLPKGPAPIVFQTYTPRTLLKYNGKDNAPVYLAVRGKVYDVSSGRNFYGPGGPYENFAGRDATRGLACQSFDEEMLTKDLDGPLDPCDDLTPEQLENLNGWIERFNEKVSSEMQVAQMSPSVAYNCRSIWWLANFWHSRRPIFTDEPPCTGIYRKATGTLSTLSILFTLCYCYRSYQALELQSVKLSTSPSPCRFMIVE